MKYRGQFHHILQEMMTMEPDRLFALLDEFKI